MNTLKQQVHVLFVGPLLGFVSFTQWSPNTMKVTHSMTSEHHLAHKRPISSRHSLNSSAAHCVSNVNPILWRLPRPLSASSALDTNLSTYTLVVLVARAQMIKFNLFFFFLAFTRHPVDYDYDYHFCCQSPSFKLFDRPTDRPTIFAIAA